MEIYRLTRHFRRLRPMRSPGRDSAAEPYHHHPHHQRRHHSVTSSCRQMLDRVAGVFSCCHCRSTSTSAASNSFRDRIRFYRVRRSACQTACIRAFLIVLNFVFLVSINSCFAPAQPCCHSTDRALVVHERKTNLEVHTVAFLALKTCMRGGGLR